MTILVQGTVCTSGVEPVITVIRLLGLTKKQVLRTPISEDLKGDVFLDGSGVASLIPEKMPLKVREHKLFGTVVRDVSSWVDSEITKQGRKISGTGNSRRRSDRLRRFDSRRGACEPLFGRTRFRNQSNRN